MQQPAIKRVTTDERDAYVRDGVVVLRGVISPWWIAKMRDAVDAAMANPGAAAAEYSNVAQGGRYFGDFFIWLRNRDFRDFALASPLPSIAQQILDARVVTFFYDQLLVKEPNTPEQTPWHQDLPYWPLAGGQILSLWVAVDPVSSQSGAMRYIRGSHRDGVLYRPRVFAENSVYAEVYDRAALPEFPDMTAAQSDPRIVVCEVEPGDVIVHHPLTFHWSPGNLDPLRRRRAIALRYLGDDAVFDDRPGTFLEDPRFAKLLPEPMSYRAGDRLGGKNFPQVWPPSSQG